MLLPWFGIQWVPLPDGYSAAVSSLIIFVGFSIHLRGGHSPKWGVTDSETTAPKRTGWSWATTSFSPGRPQQYVCRLSRLLQLWGREKTPWQLFSTTLCIGNKVFSSYWGLCGDIPILSHIIYFLAYTYLSVGSNIYNLTFHWLWRSCSCGCFSIYCIIIIFHYWRWWYPRESDYQ